MVSSCSKEYLFVINCFLEFSVCSVLNAIFKFAEGKVIIRIVSSSEDNNVFVITFVFPKLK